jgi:short-subunit dehydrogenase
VHQAYRVALVTGASSGIGEHIARLAAADGADLVVVARRTERLDRLATAMRVAHQVSVEVLTADLTQEAGVAAVQARLADPARPVELLVNNAGFGVSGEFADLAQDDVVGQVRLNALALVRLTHAALPQMLAAGHGGVLNVSSVAGFFAMPGSAVYSATKAFVTTFSESVHAEVSDRGVHVTALCPGFTRTEFHDDQDDPAGVPRFAWLDAQRVARAGLDAVAAGRPLCVPGAQYQAVTGLSRIVPRRAIRYAMKTARRREGPPSAAAIGRQARRGP